MVVSAGGAYGGVRERGAGGNWLVPVFALGGDSELLDLALGGAERLGGGVIV